MHALITGASGFLGSYLIQELEDNNHSVVATSLNENKTLFGHQCSKLDFCNYEEISSVIKDCQPDVIFHLGAISFVPDAEKDFLKTLEVNVVPVHSILKVISDLKLKTKFVFMSSAEVYGHSAKTESILTEETPVKPGNSYSLSKLMAEEIILKYYNSSALSDYTIIRPFNTVGFGQNTNFALASFAEQIRNKQDLKVGNLEVYRDFINVKDTVRGIRLAAEKSTGIFNLCSGNSYLLSDLVKQLIELSGLDLKFEVDQARYRPAEVLTIKGSAEKARRSFEWEPQILIKQTLQEILAIG